MFNNNEKYTLSNFLLLRPRLFSKKITEKFAKRKKLLLPFKLAKIEPSTPNHFY